MRNRQKFRFLLFVDGMLQPLSATLLRNGSVWRQRVTTYYDFETVAGVFSERYALKFSCLVYLFFFVFFSVFFHFFVFFYAYSLLLVPRGF